MKEEKANEKECYGFSDDTLIIDDDLPSGMYRRLKPSEVKSFKV